jgi:hypothetical protein
MAELKRLRDIEEKFPRAEPARDVDPSKHSLSSSIVSRRKA